MLSLFLEFCGSHADATVSTNCLTLWLEIENHRQLIGDHRSLQRNGHRLWNWYLKKTIAGNVRHLVPHKEVSRLRSLCSSSTATGITLDTFSKVQVLLQCHIVQTVMPSFVTSATYQTMVQQESRQTNATQSHLLEVLGDSKGPGSWSDKEIESGFHVYVRTITFPTAQEAKNLLWKSW